MRHAFVLLVLVAGCRSPTPPSSFGVNITLDANSLSSMVRSEITQASLSVTGDETYHRTFDIRSSFSGGQVRFRYVPGVQSGTLTLTLDALTTDGALVGRTPPATVTLLAGHAVDATLTLASDSGDDMGTSSDDGGGGCDPGFHSCNGSCVDERSLDSCGVSCSPCPVGANATAATCDGTSCGLQCANGYHVCGNACVSATSANSCNMSCTPCSPPTGGNATCDGTSCGGSCLGGQKLCFGACIPNQMACNGSCPGGTHECSGNCFDNTSVNSCGASCTPCPVPPNATMATCAAGGACGFVCNSGYKACGSTCIPSTGCCTNADCAQPANGVATCDTGSNSCVIACNSSYTKCGSECITTTACCVNSDCAPPTNGTATCNASHACVPMCNAPSSTVCGGACVDTSSDNANCGGCGKSCGGQCALGRCQVVVASQQSFPDAIAVDSTNVYWTTFGNNTNGTIMKAPVGGGAATPLATGQSWANLIAIDGTSVYWTTGNMYQFTHTVNKVPIAGGATTSLLSASSEGYLSGLAVDATNVYWMTQNDSVTANVPAKVRTVPLGGGTASTVTSGPSNINYQGALVFDANNAYLVDLIAKTVVKAPKTGGTEAILASGFAYPDSIAVDANSVYVMDGSAAPISIVKIPNTGGSPVTVASNLAALGMMIVDGTTLYFTSNGNPAKIMKVSTSGGTPVVLADGQPSIYGIAVDATSVYWVTYVDPGSVMKLTPK